MPESSTRGEEAARLPKLWAGRRRRDLSLLVLSGFGQAAAAGTGALLLSSVLSNTRPSQRGLVLGLLVTAALAIGLLRMAEKILAERLSQNYVHQIRLGLLRRNLLDGKVKSLGVAVSRTTNDLTSVKNWVSQGVAPLAVGIPLILGAAVALMWLHPLLALALVIPVGALLVAMAMISPVAYRRSRNLRRHRGRLSSQVADTVLATEAIRSAGGSDRELRRIGRRSRSLVTAAVDRSKAAGGLRGAAAATSGIAAAMVVAIGLSQGLETHRIAGALAIVGFLSNPIHDFGRVAEYRQSYRAARRIIAPVITDTTPRSSGAAAAEAEAASSHTSSVPTRFEPSVGVFLSEISLEDGRILPEVQASCGARIVIETDDRQLDSQLLARLVGVREPRIEVVVTGRRLSEIGPIEHRSLVGYAAQGMMLERGTVLRSVRYRCPDGSAEEAEGQLTAVGLAARVAELPEGVHTRLVHGGDPLSIAERGRLLLARASFLNPPLLVLDKLDADLGDDGRKVMRDFLHDYPGVVVVATDRPSDVVDVTQVWRPESAEDFTQ